MMNVIFECETELGKCDCETLQTDSGGLDSRYASVFARTLASVNGHKGMLKVEHQCYLRRGEDIPEQPWIRPEIILEPAQNSKSGMVAFAKKTHERFVEQVRRQIPVELLPTSP